MRRPPFRVRTTRVRHLGFCVGLATAVPAGSALGVGASQPASPFLVVAANTLPAKAPALLPDPAPVTLASLPQAAWQRAWRAEPASFTPNATNANLLNRQPGRAAIATAIANAATSGLEVSREVPDHGVVPPMPQHLYMGKRGVGLKFGF